MMTNSLFLQSDVRDPYALYAHMREDRPVFHDEANGIWAIYRHAHCRQILEAGSAHIPGQNAALMPLLNGAATTWVANFARLANPPAHAERREAALRLLSCMQRVDAAELLAQLIGRSEKFDWIDAVCKKLPAFAVMKAFGFSAADIETILPKMERLTKIMLPNKTPAQIADINQVAEEIHLLVERHLTDTLPALAETAASRGLHASNLVGLLIQSHDAGRGLLSNALLQVLQHAQYSPADSEGWQRIIVETLRFDPPIQNTRRVLADALEVGGQVLPKGAAVLLVLASANRDESVFAQANRFDAARTNNAAHLTFGAGAHRCAAHHFAVDLAAQALAALFEGSRRIALLHEDIRYEPMVNARLPTQLLVAYSS